MPSGYLLPPELLARVAGAGSDLDGLAPADYGLRPADRLGEAAARAWARAKNYWAAFRSAAEELPEGDGGLGVVRQQWLLPLLRELGYASPEFHRGGRDVGGRHEPIEYWHGGVPLHLVGPGQDLDRPPVGAGRARRPSPHSQLSQCLNASDDPALAYGLVSNGLALRLLRRSPSLTREAYLQFDLQAMLENGEYAEFVLLFLTLHRSRLPGAPSPGGAGTQPAAPCWLDRWRDQDADRGSRARGELRQGVEAAIEVLGRGFLAHPANESLRARLASEALAPLGYYQQLLRLIYRLLFLLVAEERGLVHAPGASAQSRRRYQEHYSVSRLREVARKRLADEGHDDLWRGLRCTFALFSGAREGLEVPPLDGGLFDEESCPDLDGALLPNAALAEAVVRLSWVRLLVGRRRVTRRVNYRDMAAEELGGIYESLLEWQPQVVVASRPRFELVQGGARKRTGSYYTPTSLVDELIRLALEPVIADRLRGCHTDEQRRRAILGIRVCDPACGSGHFLLAAAKRLALELARLEGGNPDPAQRRLALRQVVRHCLYGVDQNPLAVDLCKLALWLEGHEPGLPLTFLDHHIKVGNSLYGATAALVADGIPEGAYEPVSGDLKDVARTVKGRNRQEGKGQLPLESELARWGAVQEELGLGALEVADLPATSLQRDQYRVFEAQVVGPRRARFDAWTAAFFWPLVKDAPPPPTTAAIRAEPPALSPEQRRLVEALRRQYRFFHWELEFPDVFADGGFDCVLGNPPWERIKLQEQEFFAERDPAIAGAPNKAARQRLIDALARSETGRALHAAFEAARRAAECQSEFARHSGRFPLTATGDVNVYALFAEHARALLGPRGRAGIIVPTGIATDDSTKRFFQKLANDGNMASLFDFENCKVFFPDVHARCKFSLLSLSSARLPHADFAFFLHDVAQAHDEQRRFQLTPEDFALLNPNTRTCPVFRTRADAELTRAIYRRVPVLVDERSGANPWGVQFLQGLFNMTSDSGLFHDAPGPGLVPLYEAKLFHHYNHRWATYAGSQARDATPAELADPRWQARPRYWVERREVEDRLAERWDRGWLLAFRNITNATNERTAIFSVLPLGGAGNNAPLLLPTEARDCVAAALVGCLSSLVFDFSVRPKVGGTHLNFFIVSQFAVLPPSAYTPADLDFIVPRVLELTYTAWDLQPFARDLGYDGPPFRWDEERRARLRAELDAWYAALYGLTRDELRYVLDPADVYGPDFPGETFRVLKERETRQYGEYRTRRLVLEAWDRLGLTPRNRDGRYAPDPPSAEMTTWQLCTASASAPANCGRCAGRDG